MPFVLGMGDSGSDTWEVTVRYMLLIYDCQRYPEGSEEAAAEKRDAVLAYTLMLRDRGVYRAVDPLHTVDTATTVRVRDGDALVTDGPYTEAREWLGGYYILECHDLDEALELAALCPMAAEGGVEVRPIMEVPGLHAPADDLRAQLADR